MFKNYLKIAIRSLWRNKSFSAINIIGLSIGIATCLIIMLFVNDEFSYDHYNKKADQIVRVVFRGTVQGGKMNEANVMPPVAQTLRNDYPEVLDATRLRDGGSPKITADNKTFTGDSFAFVDSNFFQVFTLPFVEGDAKTALAQPNTIVISKSIAKKYFGNTDPIGKILDFKDNKTSFKITGVIENVPANSHFHIDLFGSMAGLDEAKVPSWLTSEFYTYLVLPKGYNYKQLEAKLPQVVEKYLGPQLKQGLGMSLAQFRQKGNDLGLYLQPLTDIHLYSNFAYDLSPSGDIRYVYIFGAIAIFMLLIACINFMNLSTAGAAKRAREVGIRKVLGSMKKELIKQFLVESILLTLVALLLAIGFVKLALPVFNNLSGKDLHLHLIAQPKLLLVFVFFGLFTGILAGSYPAFFLSAFNPITVLKGTFTSGKKSSNIRSGLVVFQFIISIVLIVSTAVVYQQLQYIQNTKLGYDKDQVLVLSGSDVLGKNSEVFRDRLLQDPRVVNVSTSGYLPAGPSYNNNFFVYTDNNSTQTIKTLRYDVDEKYIPTLGMQMVSGRNFSKDFTTDSSAAIINETAAQVFGWGKNAIGHTITRAFKEGNNATYNIIGVVKDFHFKSLHERISPLVMVMGNNSGAIIVKVKTRDIAGLLSFIKTQWTQLAPEEPFNYSFLDDRFNETYKAEQKTGQILGIFALLTILVACLGVFGLATYTSQQRTKEIGIRKVLGASASGIVSLLTKDFLKLVFVAFVIASPIACFIMNKWLQDFAYRININWSVFVLAAFLSIAITIISVSFKAIKAAMANPVKSLRTE